MSNLEFKFGSENNPKGHAIIYFEEYDEIYAAYIMNFPISGDLSKYIPEMFKDQIPDEEMTKMIFPPIPEKFNGDFEKILALSEKRSDDLIYGGSINSKDTSSAMSKLNSLANDYTNLCNELGYDDIKSLIDEIPKITNELNDSNYSMMSESDLLTEITKLIGKIKFSKDNNELNEIKEIIKEIRIISKIIPENRKINKLLDYVHLDNANSQEIISAYISRAYGLLNEDYIKVKELEDQIHKLEPQ
jgi:hypothetical protein